MKTKLFLLGLLIFLLSPAYAQPIDYILQPNSLILESNASGFVMLRITHTNETNITLPISLSYVSPFELNFSNNNFNLAVYENLNISVNIPYKQIKAGSYNNLILIQTPSEVFAVLLIIEINQTESYDFTNFTNKTFKQSEKGVFYLNISNEGNVDLELPINASDIFLVVNSIKIPIGCEISLPVFYDIPENFSSGNHLLKINIGNKTLEINASIIDGTLPIISLDIPDEIYVKERIEFNISCQDNENISSFIYKIGTNLTKNATQPHTFTEVNDYEIIFICSDNYLNNCTEKRTISVVPIPIQDLEKEIVIPKRKKGERILQKLFFTPAKVKANITLESFNYSGEAKIILRSGGNSVYLAENSSIDFSIEGDAFLELSDLENDGDYNGVIKFFFGDDADETEIEMNINGSVGEYSVRDPFNMSLRGFNLNCRGIDTGDGSEVICDGFRFPSDISPEEYVFFWSRSQVETEKQLFDSMLEEEKKKTGFAWMIIKIIIGLSIVGVIIIFVIPKVMSAHPRIRGSE